MKLLPCLAFVPALILCGCAETQRETGAGPASSPAPGVFFVATNGNDAWSGSLPSPNRKNTAGPFATVRHALEAARQFKATNTASVDPAVCVRGGTYPLEAPLVITPEHSGLTFSAFPGESPVISGGRRVSGWREVTVAGKTGWAADLPEVREGKWYFRELWVNGKRAQRARHPDKGYLKVAELPDKTSSWTEGQRRFRFREGDLKASINASDAEVVVMAKWVESRLPIKDIDQAQRMLNFQKRSVFQLETDDLYYVEGALEFLDQPGEWWLDKAKGTLYYLPRPSEQIAAVEAFAPVLSQVLRVEGKPASGQFVERLTVRGLTFSHTEWCFPDQFFAGSDQPNIDPAPDREVGGFAQAAIGVPAAIRADGLRGSRFENCAVVNIGTYGLELAQGCQSNIITACSLHDLGAGGIKIGETRLRDKDAQRTFRNEVSDCRIYDGGRLFHSAIGLWIGQSSENRLLHNLISDLYYTGISIGWTWGYDASQANGNIVEFNDVHHIGARSDGDGPILSDMAGIYTLGKQPGTVIRNNLWHDMAATRYGGWGIYFDEGSSGVLAESNVVYRTTHGGFHQHYGETNIVRNNVFAFARDHQLQRTRKEPHVSFTFTNNIVYFDTGTLLAGDWSDDKFNIDGNVYWDTRTGTNVATFSLGQGTTLAKWRGRGHDVTSVLEDPPFMAPRQGDFRFRDNSPALKTGFHPIDVSHVGPRVNPLGKY